MPIRTIYKSGYTRHDVICADNTADLEYYLYKWQKKAESNPKVAKFEILYR